MANKYKTYFVGILIPVAVGIVSSLLVQGNFVLYEELTRPPLAPPKYIFPIVWTILYILMGISSARIYLCETSERSDIKQALTLYGVQLVFNFMWPIAFFNFEALLFAFIWLMIMWVIIILMIIKFYTIDKTAAYLQIPYLLWTTFAAYLNFGFYLLNR